MKTVELLSENEFRVTEEFTRDDLIRVVFERTGRRVGVKQFYKQLPYCLIPAPKNFYSSRDLEKFIFIAQTLNRVRKLEVAREKLIHDIQTNAHRYSL
jgi:hypothetical protein